MACDKSNVVVLECQLDEGIASGDDTLVIYEDY